jgi:hypothetical protein
LDDRRVDVIKATVRACSTPGHSTYYDINSYEYEYEYEEEEEEEEEEERDIGFSL